MCFIRVWSIIILQYWSGCEKHSKWQKLRVICRRMRKTRPFSHGFNAMHEKKKWQRVLSWCVNVSSVAHKKLVISTCVKGSWWEHEKMNEEKTNLINFLNMCFLFSQGASLDVYMQSFKQVLSVTFFHSLCRCLSKFFTKFNFSLSKNSWKTSLGEHLIGKIEIELFLILGILLLAHSWHLW